MIPTDDLYLLGILNSASAWDFLHATCQKLQHDALAIQTPYLKKLPIPDTSPADRAAIAALAEKCLAAKGVDCAAWEQEINERVAALDGL